MYFVLNKEWYVFHFTNVQNSRAWDRNYQKKSKARSFNRGPLYLGGHWCHSHDKMDQAFPHSFCILQVIINWTVGRPGNEASIWE